MKKKSEVFNPKISRVKLSPEQAVVGCNCFNNYRQSGAAFASNNSFCIFTNKGTFGFGTFSFGALNS